MAIITTYPFKKDPLSKNDEIIISDYYSNNPKFKTKLTNVETLSKFVVSISSFIFTQSVPSDNWVIQHDLNKFCSVTVVDSANQVCIGDITYDSTNQLTITFSAPFSGKAYLN